MLIVQKYGGSSVGSPEKIKQIASRIAQEHRNGHNLVVVVSAMGDTTDDLVALAKQITPNPAERELDMLLTAGERISMALLSMALREEKVEAISFTGSQAGIITNDTHTKAQILEIKPVRVQEELSKGKVVIVAGFQGVSRSKEITTLGRGGSDTTAVALAASLKADRCEVFTDVPGYFSADPRLIRTARRYENLPLEMGYELSLQGAQIMHPKSLETALENNFVVYVGLSNEPTSISSGTFLVPGKDFDDLPKVVGVTGRAGSDGSFIVSIVGVDLHRDLEFSSKVLSVLTEHKIPVRESSYHSGYSSTSEKSKNAQAGSLNLFLADKDGLSAIQIFHDSFVSVS
ncbi:MAG: aspartate kinase [Bacteriovoracia bacterium]